jgi:hypothetical protein
MVQPWKLSATICGAIIIRIGTQDDDHYCYLVHRKMNFAEDDGLNLKRNGSIVYGVIAYWILFIAL